MFFETLFMRMYIQNVYEPNKVATTISQKVLERVNFILQIVLEKFSSPKEFN